MALNKHTGLYLLPAHHRHGTQPTSRPSFNSMDYEAAGSTDEQDVEKPEESGRPKSAGTEMSRTPAAAAPPATFTPLDTDHPLVSVTPATGSSKVKRKSKGKKSEKQKRKSTGSSSKKRKRQSEGTPAPPKTGLASLGFVLNGDMLESVKSSVKKANEAFSGSQPAAVIAAAAAAAAAAADIPLVPASEPVKKKAKKEKANSKSPRIVDFDRMADETREIDKKERESPLESEPSFVLIPHLDFSGSPLIFSSPPRPRNTPVPVPPNAFSHAANARRVGRRDSRLLVLETPPQLTSQPGALPDTPVPFKLTGVAKSPSLSMSSLSLPPAVSSPPLAFTAPASIAPGTVPHASSASASTSASTTILAAPASTAPPTLKGPAKLEVKHDGRVALTASNLHKYMTMTTRLSDEPKPRPKSRAAVPVSSGGSTTSVGTTPSIKEYLERVEKPDSRSGAEHDPFTAATTAAKKKKPVRETQQEADIGTFLAAYADTQYYINFSDERDYLLEHRDLRNSAHSVGTAPCLGQASGCNPKRETILRLSREDAAQNAGRPAFGVSSAEERALLTNAVVRGQTAEWFLARSIMARVPVPLGKLEGVWKLYCPSYAQVHVDRYGYGQRTLSLSKVPGSVSAVDSHARYTVRLSIPPRSVVYSVEDFIVPPHASFRSTTVHTTEERYKMDFIFLGNGYLFLRVDLSLLSGKEMRNDLGRPVIMEFVGIHEQAVVWEI